MEQSCVLSLFFRSNTQVPFHIMDNGKKVWAPDLVQGFILGEVTDFGTDEIEVQPLDGSKTIKASFDSVYPAEDDDNKNVEDNCKRHWHCM